MSSGLTRALLGASRHRGGHESVAVIDLHEHAVRVDHVVFAEAAARLVLPALRSLELPRMRAAFALMGGDPRRPPPASPPSGLAAGVHDAALGLGMHVVRPGCGRLEAIYVDRYAAPGRTVACAGESVAAAGAIGTLALECGELELAAVLAGAPRFVRDDDVLWIRLVGSPVPCVGGADVAFEIARRLSPLGAGRRPVEFSGEGVASLTIPDRMILAGRSAEWGASGALFPADQVTRDWLAVHGRGSDWRKAEGEESGDPGLEIDLGAVEPQFAELGRPETARPVPGVRGPEVTHVAIGPGATAADLLRFARWLRGREIPRGMTLTLLPGSRERLEAASHAGGLQDLVAQGGVIETDGRNPAAPAAGGGVCYGARPEDLEGTRVRWWAASLETCTAAVLTGRLTDPRRVVPAEPALEEPGLVSGDEAWVLRPRPEDPAAAPPEPRSVPVGEPLGGPVRGRVLLRCGDDVTVDQVLPWGARIAPLAGDVHALKAHAFAGIDPHFAGRAAACGGGFVLAGEGIGRGAAREQAGLALAALGVRAVIAQSWDAGFRRRLLDAGVLPLRFARAADLDAFAAGDELELATLPHGLEPGRSLVVRNLTRGTQLDIRHDLDARDVVIAKSGGMLRYASDFGTER